MKFAMQDAWCTGNDNDDLTNIGKEYQDIKKKVDELDRPVARLVVGRIITTLHRVGFCWFYVFAESPAPTQSRDHVHHGINLHSICVTATLLSHDPIFSDPDAFFFCSSAARFSFCS